MLDLLQAENAELRREVADLKIQVCTLRAALAAERDAHMVTMLNRESEADLRITTVTHAELRDMWAESDRRAELDLLNAQARDDARARGWDEPTKRERPVVSETTTVRDVRRMTMAELVFGGGHG